MDRQMDRVGCRVACTRLKTLIFSSSHQGQICGYLSRGQVCWSGKKKQKSTLLQTDGSTDGSTDWPTDQTKSVFYSRVSLTKKGCWETIAWFKMRIWVHASEISSSEIVVMLRFHLLSELKTRSNTEKERTRMDNVRGSRTSEENATCSKR